MSAYVDINDVVKKLIETKDMDFQTILIEILNLPITDMDEKNRLIDHLKKELSDLREKYINHLKHDIDNFIKEETKC